MSQKVRVYWNLNRDCWSILYKRKVIGYAKTILLQDVRFIVSEAGRQRVLAQKRKNVHAFAEGIVLRKNVTRPVNTNIKVSYNPYKGGFFFKKDTEERVEKANSVFCDNKVLYVE